MDAIEAIHGRRSIRDYQARPLERDLIEALIWDAAQAPPPALRFTHRCAFTVVEGAERLAGLGNDAKAYARSHRPATGGAWLDDPAFKVFWNAPALILICAAQDQPETDWDAVRAAQNLMISAHARGLGACWVGSPMAWLRSAEGAAAVGVPDGFAPVAPMLVGYPAVTSPARQAERPQVVWS
jgi:nitroreductase